METFSLANAHVLLTATNTPAARDGAITSALTLLERAEAGILEFEAGAREVVEQIAVMF